MINIVTKPNNNLCKFFRDFKDNKDYFYESKSVNAGWSDTGKDKTGYIGKWSKKNDLISICLVRDFGIERLLFKNDIPDPETIKKYIKDIAEAGEDKLKIEEIRKKYEALGDKQVKDYMQRNKQYDYNGFREKNYPGFFDNNEKKDPMNVIIIKESMITKEVEEEDGKDAGKETK